MRKFFSIVLFVLFAVSLFTVTGCGETTPTVIRQVDSDDYSFTIICMHKAPYLWGSGGEYAFEFKGGNPEQRQDQKTMLLYTKGITDNEIDAHLEISKAIYMLEQLLQKQ